MTAPVHAFFHHPENIEYAFACICLTAPGQFIFHHYLGYLEAGFNAPVEQVAGCFNREWQVDLSFALTCFAILYDEPATDRIKRPGNGFTITQKCLESNRIWMKRQLLVIQKQQIFFD